MTDTVGASAKLIANRLAVSAGKTRRILFRKYRLVVRRFALL